MKSIIKKKYDHKVAKKKEKSFLLTKKSDQLLTTTDRLIYIYVIDTNTNKTIAVVNVSYEIKIKSQLPQHRRHIWCASLTGQVVTTS
jgi:hypothetical protein